ncbi:hypothetical protein YH65_02305 [Sulfurovum lithotrophicum]|uniref:Glycosyl transferase family 1 n=1 Tax=Sulfurovum lithotrophicum TaxID=206403 RepID=A0A7U4RQ44_9BACT|nr:glycosyltransferase [Sulfurovum lithotrophicum]AKF24356.1 hypothetical protein YH65_02305 [Sulfurovum lithotrophicum]
MKKDTLQHTHTIDTPVIHITEDFSKMSGGLRTVISDLNGHLRQHSVESSIVTTLSEKDDNVILYPRDWPKGLWDHAGELESYLKKHTDAIFHIHGIWMYPQYIASKIAQQENVPSVLSPHGMLQPWLWEQGTLKKRIYFEILVKKYFQQSTVIHAITPNEKENLFQEFPHQNIEVIPNSISYKEIESYNIQKEEKEKYILFLGRLHKVKGIDLLIKAFAQLNAKEMKLKIAGPINEYKETLDGLIKALGVEAKVEFLGLVSKREKYQLYKNAWVFVLPSYSEVIGMVNLEAGILETPVITTHQTGIYPEWQENGGMLIDPNIEALKKSLQEAVSWSESERNERGRKLKAFIIEHYSWENNVYKWKELYEGVASCRH